MSTTEHVMSKFLNNPDDVVPESLAGLQAAHPDLVRVDAANQVVLRAGGPVHIVFLALVVMNLVGGFHALGTLLAVGLMMLPAAAARFWARDITLMIAVAVAIGILSGYLGLLLSFHSGVPAGPAIILVAGAAYAGSVLLGSVGGLLRRSIPRRHLEA